MNWVVPTDMWKDKDVWILGGGPSLSRQFKVPNNLIKQVEKGQLPVSVFSPFMKAIHDQPVIGINMAFLLGEWIDLVFWGDPSFYRMKNVPQLLKQFPNLKIGCNQWFNDKKMEANGIWAIAREKEGVLGISNNPAKVRWNYNSGATAISIAANAGAKRIILVGFDMNRMPTHSHWHNMYGGPKNPGFKQHLKGFKQIAIDAEERGIEIINASPNSSIAQFPKANVFDIINNEPNSIIVDNDVEKSIGVLNKYQTLSNIHSIVKPQCYLEIGVARGNSLKLSNAKITIGVDANPRVLNPIPNAKIFKDKSVEFFEKQNFSQPIDLAFIDGSHLIEDVLKDFINIEKHSHKQTVLVLDDVSPAHPIQGNRIKQSIKWAGDVWKIVEILKELRPDLTLTLLDVAPTGMLVVTGLDSSNLVLESKYDELVNYWKNKIMPFTVIERIGAVTDLSFLKREPIKRTKPVRTKFKNQTKPKVAVLTPTNNSDRKPFLDFLEKRIQAQTRKPDKWLKVDYPNKDNKIDLSNRYKQGITQLFEEGFDLIIFMEDDDYYPVTYVEEMIKHWELADKPSLIGVKTTTYYYLKTNTHRFFKNETHCSAFCTAVSKEVEYESIPDGIRTFDLQLWKINKGVKAKFENLPIGIKHGLGITGVQNYHNVPKKSLSMPVPFNKWVDDEAFKFYEHVKKLI